MSLVRPTPLENQYNLLFFGLQYDRPMYYILVVRTAKNLFIGLGFDGTQEGFPDKVAELDNLIREMVEIPLEANFQSVVHAYDSRAHYHLKRAFTYVGEGIDAREVTRYEIFLRLEAVKDFAMNEVNMLSYLIRFTRPLPMG